MIEKIERLQSVDPLTNKLEHEWWERNAALVSRFWEMDTSISDVLRRRYLHAIKRFFLEGRSEVKVLELGCGSGWVGQSIAGGNVKIVGTDFSESQIEMARSRAVRQGIAHTTSYHVMSSGEWPAEAQECGAVLIHSFLHHLDWNEINKLLDELKMRVAPGTRIAFFEPAFYEASTKVSRSRVSESILRLAERMVSKVNSDMSAGAQLDFESRDRFLKLFEDAEANGWYLSPKEVPFGQEKFTAVLQERFDVVSSSWAIIFLIGWVFERNLLKNKPQREHWLWPWIVRLDAMMARDTAFLQSRLRKPAHAFHLWHCVKR